LLGEDWFDRLEAGVRQHIRSCIEAMLESELEAVLNCGRYENLFADGACRPVLSGMLL
jgi:hypothetical protein